MIRTTIAIFFPDYFFFGFSGFGGAGSVMTIGLSLFFLERSLPHSGQNDIPSWTCAPQLGQYMEYHLTCFFTTNDREICKKVALYCIPDFWPMR